MMALDATGTFFHITHSAVAIFGTAALSLAINFINHSNHSDKQTTNDNLPNIISDITDLVAHCSDTSHALNCLCEIACKEAKAKSASILSLGAPSKDAEFSTHPNYQMSDNQPESLNALLIELAKTGETKLYTADSVPKYLFSEDVAHVMIVPLSDASKNVYAYLTLAFSKEDALPDIHSTNIVCGLVGLGITAARRLDSKRNLGEDLRKLEQISRIMCEVGPQARVAEVREAVVKTASDVLNTPHVALFTIDPYMGDFVCDKTPEVTDDIQAAFIELSSGILTNRECEETLIFDIPPGFRGALSENGIKHVAACPIRSNVGASGALVAFHTSQVYDTYLLEAITAQASAMISYALSIEQSRSFLDDLAGENQELSVQATSDGLTGLINHKTLQKRLGELCKKPRPNGNSPRFCLIMVDVDHFKRYNDTYGHQEGDIVLRTVAHLLAAQLRQSDFAARYGGEEFAIVIRGIDKEAASSIAERIRFAVEQEPLANGSVTVSMGIAEYPNDACLPSELIKRSDKALYHAKLTGRNRVAIWGIDISNAEDDSESLQSQHTV